MTERIEQWICIQFCVKPEHSSTEAIQMILKATAMGNWWLAASSQQHVHSCITSPAIFWKNIKSPRWRSLPYSQNLIPWHFWLFLKLKLPSKMKRFQTIDKIQGKTTGQLMVMGRTVWGPKVPTLKENEMSLSYIQCFLCLVSSSISVSIFHSTWLHTSGQYK